MNDINTENSASYIFDKAYKKLINFLKDKQYSQCFILVDDHTKKYCLPVFKKKVSHNLINKILSVKSGESSKSFDTCTRLWGELAEHDADRQALLINLGGGMITDLGGFVASTYKRGIDFINIPTTLLAMVDASIGGKTGINLNHLKNQIGTVQDAKLVLFDFDFLKTLAETEVKSGFAEILKHSLIADKIYWQQINDYPSTLKNPESIIKRSVLLKSKIVEQDPRENGIRKHLNFGHTLGHAIESYFHKNANTPLLHGEAVAHGMILEAYLSFKTLGLSESELIEITNRIHDIFKIKKFSSHEQDEIIKLMRYDKKNKGNKVLFVLLPKIGEARTDISVDDIEIKKAFTFSNNFNDSK